MGSLRPPTLRNEGSVGKIVAETHELLFRVQGSGFMGLGIRVYGFMGLGIRVYGFMGFGIRV